MPFPRYWEFFEKWMITDRCENVLDALEHLLISERREMIKSPWDHALMTQEQ